jgi:hypothetical protein
MFENGGPVTKIIDPSRHAVLDYATAGTFFTLAARYRNTNRAASTLAFINGASVLLLSLFTDYPGGVIRKLSFRTHGMVDAIQASMSALGPALFGFAGTPEAKVFYAQAAAETGVIMATDFSATDTFDGRLAGD